MDISTDNLYRIHVDIKSITSFLTTFLLIVAAALAFLHPADSAAAQGRNTYTVTKVGDTDDGACTADCSLREAVAAANSSAGADTIVMSPAVLLTGLSLSLTLGDLNLDDDVTLDCGGKTIDANGNSRVILAGGYTIVIDSCTIANGATVNGAGIYNSGDLTLTNSTVSGNAASGDGGGIYNHSSGTLTLVDSAVVQNSAEDFGGGIRSAGTMTATNSTIDDNTAWQGGGIYNHSSGILTLIDSTVNQNDSTITGSGGGIRNNGAMTITNSTINDNTGGSRGGGIYNHSSGTLTLIDSTVNQNDSTSGSGGGIRNDGTMTATHSTINDNTAEQGGGISNLGTLTLVNATVSWNNANPEIYGIGGGILNRSINGSGGRLTLIDTTVTQNHADEDGGGIFNQGAMIVTNSTISNNEVRGGFDQMRGGGIFTSSTMTITNSTITGNTASLGGGFYHAYLAGEATIKNVTIVYNNATESGSGIYNRWDTINLSNAIVAENVGDNCFNHDAASFNAYFVNLDDDGTCPGFTTGSAGLGPLQDNGGPTLTHLPGLQSDAVDAGEPTVCAELGNVDQRGYSRLDADGNGDPSDGNPCDLGAVERGGAAPEPPDKRIYLPLVTS